MPQKRDGFDKFGAILYGSIEGTPTVGCRPLTGGRASAYLNRGLRNSRLDAAKERKESQQGAIRDGRRALGRVEVSNGWLRDPSRRIAVLNQTFNRWERRVAPSPAANPSRPRIFALRANRRALGLLGVI